MSTSTRDAVAPVCEAVAAVLRDPPAVDLGASTPCSDFDLRALVEHVVGTSSALARLGQGEELDPEDPWGGGRGAADGDWTAVLQTSLAGIRDGWSRAEAWEGEASAGGTSPMPRRLIGEMALVEVALHGWDLARALDRRVELEPDVAEAVCEAVAASAALGRTMGVYGPEITVAEGASGLDRALAESGRDPAWSA